MSRPPAYAYRWTLLLCAMRMAWPQSARADVVYSGMQDIAIPADFDGVYLNVVTKQHSTSEISGWDLNAFFGGLGIANSPSFQPVRMGTGNEDSIVPISFGSSINGSLSFSADYGCSGAEDDSGHLGPGVSQFTDGQAAYIGFQLTRNNTVNYGWMQVTLTRDGSNGLIQDWAYDTTGSAILAGATGNVGAAPRIIEAGSAQVAPAVAAGTAVLVSTGAQFTFQETTTQGNFSGIISGGGNVNVAGAGGIRLTGTNTFTGTAAVLDGSSLTVTTKDNLGAAAIQLAPAAALVFDSLAANNGTANTFSNPITVTAQTGTLRNTGDGTVVLTGTLTKDGSVLAFSNGNFEVRGAIQGASANSDLIVDGATVSLLTANSYNGPTLIRNEGTLLVNNPTGTGTGTGTVTVNAGSTLGGSGTIGGNVTLSGTLAPGDAAIGKLTVKGNLNFASDSTFAYEMNSSMGTGDLVVVEGAGGVAIGTHVGLTLADVESGTFEAGTTLSLIEYEGSYSGIFTYEGNELSEGEAFTDGKSNHWTIHYNANSGGSNFNTALANSHYILLSLTAIPEVSSLLVLACLISSGVFFRSKPRR
ncbi:MAG: hypothetical protein WCP35_09195 [Verrucomicrobiota bacterium]